MSANIFKFSEYQFWYWCFYTLSVYKKINIYYKHMYVYICMYTSVYTAVHKLSLFSRSLGTLALDVHIGNSE